MLEAYEYIVAISSFLLHSFAFNLRSCFGILHMSHLLIVSFLEGLGPGTQR